MAYIMFIPGEDYRRRVLHDEHGAQQQGESTPAQKIGHPNEKEEAQWMGNRGGCVIRH